MNQKNLQRTVQQTQKQLQLLYRNQSTQLFNQLNAVFAKMERDLATDGKIYLNDVYRTNNFHLLLNYFNQNARKVGGKQVKIVQQSMLQAYKNAQKTIAQLEPKIGKMRPMFQVPNAVDAKSVINKTWCIDGKNYSDRIWLNKNQLVSSLSGKMQDHLSRGISSFDISRILSREFQVNQFRAYRIARTQAAHANIVGQTNKYKQLGYSYGIFKATDPCGQCDALDGQEFTLDQLETMIPVHPNCQCSFLLKV